MGLYSLKTASLNDFKSFPEGWLKFHDAQEDALKLVKSGKQKQFRYGTVVLPVPARY